MLKSIPASAPRYIAKKRNGVWHVFDRIWYGVVGSEPTEGRAQGRCDNLNSRKGVKK